MDQTASAVGNLVTIDFFEKDHPVIEPVQFDFASCGHALCIIDTGADHADLTDEYAAIPGEIKAVAAYFGKEVLTQIDEAELAMKDSLLRKQVKEEEQFDIAGREKRNLPIEGLHFFTPLKGVVSQGYDPAVHPYIDITAPAGSVVKAVLDGTVINDSWSEDTGYTIQIQHDGDIISIYKHNEKLLKKAGDKVTAGTPIALVGNTGELTTGDHLHFELWHKGQTVDPTLYIKF
jgi:murein DD-endopeptidase MepM/ murein hydrolase activator NlpD